MYRLIILFGLINATFAAKPIVVGTWVFSLGGTQSAWNDLKNGADGVDSLVSGCSYCEQGNCGLTVGFGGSPDESGETTLDALIYDGKTMDVGAVADLRRVKNAVGVAKHVLQHTKHSILAGDQATEFAKQMGFTEESLSTNVSTDMWETWRNGNCQPNYWKNVDPDPTQYCGPYTPLNRNNIRFHNIVSDSEIDIHLTHDTIGMVVIDNDDNIVAGTSTNGLRHKIAGRVGDSPIAGSGAYADNEVGGACATGDGDTMLRFVPSFLAVEEMRNGKTPKEAADEAIARISKHYPNFSGAVIAVNKNGEVGAACNYMVEFPYTVMTDDYSEPQILTVPCTNTPREFKGKYCAGNAK
ncbi:N(4)-(Beta-N-acetylglucosaminyl)-L-asparaginase-like [Onthophagus taurus]|uniref:N(4)-(Beta-N-acetylglucosaminyl)-L-asparaginase- like n=1 Tax=Onthophagus taurus TaxID=166361 RepID=UPI0039BDECBC